LIAAWVVTALRGGKLYAVSGDVAFHYDLASYIAKAGKWPPLGALASGMDSYPPIPHTLAAVVGGLLGSTLMGMNVLAVT
jgi:hypothetical protein